MPKPRQLSPLEARGTLISRLAGGPGKIGLVDKVRQIGTKLGARPYEVDLVWVKWSGERIGIGDPVELARLPIVPNPILADLTAITQTPYSAGILPVGAVRLSEISAGQFTEDLLRGFVLPGGKLLPLGVCEFFYEVRIDGRMTSAPQQRARYRLLGNPYLDTCCVQFAVVLERASEDPSRAGTGLVVR